MSGIWKSEAEFERVRNGEGPFTKFVDAVDWSIVKRVEFYETDKGDIQVAVKMQQGFTLTVKEGDE